MTSGELTATSFADPTGLGGRSVSQSVTPDLQPRHEHARVHRYSRPGRHYFQALGIPEFPVACALLLPSFCFYRAPCRAIEVLFTFFRDGPSGTLRNPPDPLFDTLSEFLWYQAAGTKGKCFWKRFWKLVEPCRFQFFRGGNRARRRE